MHTFIIVFGLSLVVYGQGDQSKTKTDKMGDIFLLAQVENCRYMSICKQNTKKINWGLGIASKPCCYSCSCQKNCDLMNTCCSNNYVDSGFNNATLNNVTEFAETNEAVEIFSSYDTLKRYLIVLRSGVEDGGITCERNNMALSSLLGYKIVTSCSEETQPGLSNMQKPWSILYESVPVYSEADKRTYKNLHCLKRHGQKSTHARYWQSIIRCEHMDAHLHRYYDSPMEMMEYALSGNVPGCNVVYEPHSTMLSQECHFVDVTICRSNTCHHSVLPMDATNVGQLSTFKNFACLYCSPDPKIEYYKTCREKAIETSFVLNIPEDDESQYNSSTELDIQFDTGGNCTRGYVFDEELLECRLVFCPRLMYNLNGSCVPLFKVLKQVYYSVMLNASLKYNGAGLKTQNNTKFTKTVQSSLQQTLKKVLMIGLELNNVDFEMYQLPVTGKQALQAFFIYLRFWSSDLTGEYYWALEKVNKLLTEYSKQTIHTEYGKVYVNLEMISSVRITPEYTLEQTSWLKLKRVYTWHNKTLSAKEILISTSSFCYKVALKYDEMKFSRIYFTVTRTNQKVYQIDYDSRAISNEPLVCLGVLFPRFAQDKVSNHKRMNINEHIQETEEQGGLSRQVSIGLAIPGSLFCSVLIIVILKLILRHSLGRGSPCRSSNANR